MLEQTRNQMAELSLHGMLKALDLRLEESVSQGWGSAEFLSALITEREKLSRGSEDPETNTSCKLQNHSEL